MITNSAPVSSAVCIAHKYYLSTVLSKQDLKQTESLDLFLIRSLTVF